MASSLTRSNISFRRQGSSGIVWGSTPNRSDEELRIPTSHGHMEDHGSSPTRTGEPVLSHSRSSGFMGTSAATYFPRRRSEEKVRDRSHKHSFIKWIKRILSKSG